MLRSFALVLVVLVTAAAPAAAQSHYIGASLVGDIVRFSRIDIDSDDPFELIPSDPSTDGETLGAALVLGTALGERWGIELEFVRSGAIERSSTQSIPPRTLPIPLPTTIPLPLAEITIRSERRHTTLGTTAWIRQEISDRFDLVYLAGITFSRSEMEQEFIVGPQPLLPGVILVTAIPGTHVIDNGVGPAIGAEGRWKLGDHFSVVPGVRLHGLSVGGRPGWLIRPSVGVRWRFGR